jgi:hypothetical protein
LKTRASVPYGALDDDEHWWLPPAHSRASLRKFLSTVQWNRTVLFVSFIQFSFVLGELITTVLEPVYPPSNLEEKMLLGVILVGSEAIGSILDFFLGRELWAWTLCFGWSWWLDKTNIVEAGSLLADLGIRLLYSAPAPVARCFHVIVNPPLTLLIDRY